MKFGLEHARKLIWCATVQVLTLRVLSAPASASIAGLPDGASAFDTPISMSMPMPMSSAVPLFDTAAFSSATGQTYPVVHTMMTMLGVRLDREHAFAVPPPSAAALPNNGGSLATNSSQHVYRSAAALGLAAIGCLSAWMTTRSPVLWRNAAAPQPAIITLSAIEQQLSAPLHTSSSAGLASLSLGNLALSTRAAPASSTWVCLAPTATVAVHTSVVAGFPSSGSAAVGALSFADASVGKPSSGSGPRWAPGTTWNRGRYALNPDGQSVSEQTSNLKLMLNSREWESMLPSLNLDGSSPCVFFDSHAICRGTLWRC